MIDRAPVFKSSFGRIVKSFAEALVESSKQLQHREIDFAVTIEVGIDQSLNSPIVRHSVAAPYSQPVFPDFIE